MADSLLVLGLTGFLVSLLRLAVFAWLWKQESAEHLRYWTLGFMAQIFAQVGMLPGLLGRGHPALQLLTTVCGFGAALLLLHGTWSLLGRAFDRRWWLVGALGLVSAGAIKALTGDFLWAVLVPTSFLACAYFAMGAALFLKRRELSGLGVGLTILALIATSLHFADFPFLAGEPAFVPWGLGLAVLNDVALTLGLVVLTFDRTHAARTLADARYAELADTIGVGTYTVTGPGHFREVNGALVRMLGYQTAAEVLALDLDRDLPFTPGEQPGALEREVLVGADAVWRRKDGRPLVVQLHGRTLRDARGRLSRGFVVDRTEAHAIEETLRRTQKLDAVGRLAGGVAHDFNNLLTIILTNLELLSLEPGDPAPLADAMEATDQAALLTRRLLAFGRKQAHHAAPVDAGATSLRTVQMLERSLGARHRVDVAGVGKELWISIDAGHLEQALVNLVLNAKDAMAEGGVIEVATRAATRGERGGVELVVSDPGHGMSPEQQARIFEPFFTTREPGRGTGLGLSTVHGIVSQASGVIDVVSAPGRGARFTLWFPGTSAPPVAAESGAPRAGRRVLVVDDEPALRRTVCRMLEAAGHVTVEASSGNQAVALIARGERFDVMLSDVRMPDGDGPSAARQVSALAPAMRVVLMSGFQEEVDEASRALSHAFLAKPFTRGDLLSALEGVPLRAAG